MERRNRSLEALKKLQYIDSLEKSEKGEVLLRWGEIYLQEEYFELTLDEMRILSELFYKSIQFLKENQAILKQDLNSYKDIKKFIS